MTDSRVMTGAELKVELTGLGLTPVWLAKQLGVGTRTVIRWLDYERVPSSVVAEINRINDFTDDEICKMLTFNQGVIRTYRTDDQYKGSKTDPLPASWHRALTYRALQHCRQSGITARVGYVGQP